MYHLVFRTDPYTPGKPWTETHSMRRAIALLALTVAGAALVGGCASNDPYATDYASIKTNPTPELRGTVERPVDTDRNMWLTNNINWRGAWDDAGRVWLFDRPTASPMPVYSTSGMPH